MSNVVFTYQILQVMRNDMSKCSLAGHYMKINEYILQVKAITMLMLSLTSPLLSSVCDDMMFPDFCVRVFLCTCYACAWFYLYGLSSHNFFKISIRKETLGCVWPMVLTSGNDEWWCLCVCVGVKMENLQLGLFICWWSLSGHFEGKSGKPVGVWVKEYAFVRESSLPYCTNIWRPDGDP